jgi:predicted phosphodiesterase
MRQNPLGRVVVLSDLHFGDDAAMLAREDVVESLLGELRGLGDIDLLVLLGDVWDMWRTGMAVALERGAFFFRTLSAWEGPRDTVLLAGNHDYHVWAYCEEGRKRRELGWEETEELSLVLAGEPSGGERICMVEEHPFSLHYPLLSLEVGGRTVLLMHGHHLDFFSRSFWWAKTAWLARWILGRSRGIAVSDLDRLNKPFFELLTNTAHVPELVSWEYRFYSVLHFFARLLRFESKGGGSPRRYTSVEDNTKEAADLLGDLLPGYIPDVFIFGHTHRAGFGRAQVGWREVPMANTGCWLDGDGDDTGGTYLVIDDGIRLRRLGSWEISMDV